jgi:dTDP-4-dehydrorhamnose 3,5-epimerase
MNRIETPLHGVLVLEPRVFSDSRGFFFESYSQRRFEELGVTNRFVQDNHSQSQFGTVRGLHYQLRHGQAKLCRVVRGEVLDIALDVRRGSPTFGKWFGVHLSAENKRQIFIPPGFAHGFAVLSESAEFLYKCDDFYVPGDEYGIAWDDPALGIDWGVAAPILSAKDQANPRLVDVNPDHLPVFTG